jgi:hypothetical protein
MSNTTLTTLAVVALALAVLAVLMSVLPLRDALRRRRRKGAPVPGDLAGLRDEVGRLRDTIGGSLRRPTVVRYDAFGDMGGRLSWSLALLDDHGDGVVVTSISGRNDARSYAKGIKGWVCDMPLSPEEAEVVAAAKNR